MSTTYSLITGASVGIGREMATILAREGQNLILVARSGEILLQLAQQLEGEFKVKVETIALDLSLAESPQRLFAETNARGLRVSTLVNNAGIGDHATFHQSPWGKQKNMIQLNLVTLSELTHLYLPAMVAAKSGKILNVASTAAFQPGPFMAVYYATKAYVVSFTDAINEELRGTGVSATALCPGPTESEFAKRAKLGGLLSKIPPASAVSVAEYGIRSLNRGKGVAIHGCLNWMMAQSIRFTPRYFVLKLIRALQGLKV